MNKKVFVAILIIAALIGAVAAATYEWWSEERVIQDKITATVTWSGVDIIDNLQTITVSITNPTATASTGTLNIKIYDGPTTTDNIIADLTPDLSVSVAAGMTENYIKTWTPTDPGSYYALATYKED